MAHWCCCECKRSYLCQLPQWTVSSHTASCHSVNSHKPYSDPNNTYVTNSLGGSNGKYAVAELYPNNTEVAYPSVEFNSPPGGAINYTTTPLTSSNSQNHLVGVQSVVVDSQDTLWILDTGRAIDPVSQMLTNAAYGGPKLIAVNLTTDQVIRTIIFPTNVAYPDSYLNDVRFDLRTNLSGITGNEGVAYITDSSVEGRNGIVVVDIGEGTSWRHLNGDPRVHPEQQFVPIVWGEEVYSIPSPGMPYAYLSFGSDGIALGADGEDLYWTPLASRTLYSIPAARLRDQSNSSEVLAQAAVQSRGQKGVNDGMETDTNGFIYMGSAEDEAVNIYNPANASVVTFVRDPRINWVDTSKWMRPCLNSEANNVQCPSRTAPFTLL